MSDVCVCVCVCVCEEVQSIPSEVRYGCLIWCSALTVRGRGRGEPLGLFHISRAGVELAWALSWGGGECELGDGVTTEEGGSTAE